MRKHGKSEEEVGKREGGNEERNRRNRTHREKKKERKRQSGREGKGMQKKNELEFTLSHDVLFSVETKGKRFPILFTCEDTKHTHTPKDRTVYLRLCTC